MYSTNPYLRVYRALVFGNPLLAAIAELKREMLLERQA